MRGDAGRALGSSSGGFSSRVAVVDNNHVGPFVSSHRFELLSIEQVASIIPCLARASFVLSCARAPHSEAWVVVEQVASIIPCLARASFVLYCARAPHSEAWMVAPFSL